MSGSVGIVGVVVGKDGKTVSFSIESFVDSAETGPLSTIITRSSRRTD